MGALVHRPCIHRLFCAPVFLIRLQATHRVLLAIDERVQFMTSANEKLNSERERMETRIAAAKLGSKVGA